MKVNQLIYAKYALESQEYNTELKNKKNIDKL